MEPPRADRHSWVMIHMLTDHFIQTTNCYLRDAVAQAVILLRKLQSRNGTGTT